MKMLLALLHFGGYDAKQIHKCDLDSELRRFRLKYSFPSFRDLTFEK